MKRMKQTAAAVLAVLLTAAVQPTMQTADFLKAYAVTEATLTVLTAPGVSVAVDGKTAETDASGKATLQVETGSKTVLLSATGFEPSYVTVEVSEDTTLSGSLHGANSLTDAMVGTVDQSTGGYYGDDHLPNLAFDGDFTEGGWQAKEKNAGDYVGVTFASAKTVRSAAVWWETGSRASDDASGYTVQYTADGNTWKNVSDPVYVFGSDYNDVTMDTVSFAPVSAKGVRLVVNGFTNDKYAAKVYELHVYEDGNAGGTWNSGPSALGTVDGGRLSDVRVQYNSDETAVRLIAAVNSLNYKQVGFAVTVEGKGRKEYVDRTVYQKVGDLTAADFGLPGGYLAVLVITDLPKDFHLTARAFAVTGDTRYSGKQGSLSRGSRAPTLEMNTQPWSVEPGVNYGDYEFCGRGEELIKDVNGKYSGYTVTYRKDGNTLSEGDLNNMVGVMGAYTVSGTAVTVDVKELPIRVRCDYASVTAEAGTFLTIPFTANLPSPFVVSIGKKGDLWGEINQSGVVPTGSNGTYTATAKMSVPFLTPGEYSINISIDSWNGGYPLIMSIPLYITESEYDNRTFRLLFAGDWDLVTVDGYMDRLEKLFYTTYARLYARFGDGNEPRTITFSADKNYDGVAYAAGNGVTVSVDFANANPYNIGFFSHEITHSVQQYGNVEYGGDAWWVENMANYGGFRYFHWANAEYVQVYKATDGSLQNWNWEAYGNNKWFFAYMDSRYPTTKNDDGSFNYGLIDSINRMFKHNPDIYYEDDPYNTSLPINQMVKDITGYDCMESLRLRFVEELQAGTWDFTGFGNYVDNFLTENLVEAPNPDYPEVKEKNIGKARGTKLDTVVSDSSNLLKNAKVLDVSGRVNGNESGEKLIDGDKSTKWCSNDGSVERGQYCLDGARQWILIDLGKRTEFNTYTVFNTAYSEWGYGNMNEWELLVSADKETWDTVDYQGDCRDDSVSFEIGRTTARYLLLKVYNPDSDGDGTLRLYELELYNK